LSSPALTLLATSVEQQETCMKLGISAKTIYFPPQCACCGSTPNTSLEASATKTTGKRTVRTQTKTSSFPYCSTCAEHVRVAESNTAIVFIGITISLFVLLLLARVVFLGIIAAAVIIGVTFIFGMQNSMRKRPS
jgi:hypothetical protein